MSMGIPTTSIESGKSSLQLSLESTSNLFHATFPSPNLRPTVIIYFPLIRLLYRNLILFQLFVWICTYATPACIQPPPGGVLSLLAFFFALLIRQRRPSSERA